VGSGLARSVEARFQPRFGRAGKQWLCMPSERDKGLFARVLKKMDSSKELEESEKLIFFTLPL
jgi:hypothetical protein